MIVYEALILLLLGFTCVMRVSAGVRGRHAQTTFHGCVILSEEQKRAKEMELYSPHNFHWTFWMIPALRDPTTPTLHRRKKVHAKSSAMTTDLYGDKWCPKLEARVDDKCPVHYILHRDINRIPENLVQARCNCKECGHGIKHVHRCIKVINYIPVFRRNDKCEYVKGLEPVPVACKCARKVIKLLN